MLKEQRKVLYDDGLGVEIITFAGIHQPFKKHFHDYYVIGFVKKGSRKFVYNSCEYNIKRGCILLINPGDYHECEETSNEELKYSAINIPKNVMSKLVYEIFNCNDIAIFNKNVIYDNSLLLKLERLVYLIINNIKTLENEELFYLILKELLQNYANFKTVNEELPINIKNVCNYIESNFSKNITLNELSKIGGVSKYHLIRLFANIKGITPYKYLEIIRINKAKELLKQNVSIVNVSLLCGFSDQSHFTNLFKITHGITPKQYKIIYEGKNKNE